MDTHRIRLRVQQIIASRLEPDISIQFVWSAFTEIADLIADLIDALQPPAEEPEGEEKPCTCGRILTYDEPHDPVCPKREPAPSDLEPTPLVGALAEIARLTAEVERLEKRASRNAQMAENAVAECRGERQKREQAEKRLEVSRAANDDLFQKRQQAEADRDQDAADAVALRARVERLVRCIGVLQEEDGSND